MVPLCSLLINRVGFGVVLPVSRNLGNRIQQDPKLPLAGTGTKADPNPTRLGRNLAPIQCASNALRGVLIDTQEVMSVGTRTHAASTDLNPIQVIEQAHAQIMVQLSIVQDDRDDAHAIGIEIPHSTAAPSTFRCCSESGCAGSKRRS